MREGRAVCVGVFLLSVMHVGYLLMFEVVGYLWVNMRGEIQGVPVGGSPDFPPNAFMRKQATVLAILIFVGGLVIFLAGVCCIWGIVGRAFDARDKEIEVRQVRGPSDSVANNQESYGRSS